MNKQILNKQTESARRKIIMLENRISEIRKEIKDIDLELNKQEETK